MAQQVVQKSSRSLRAPRPAPKSNKPKVVVVREGKLVNLASPPPVGFPNNKPQAPWIGRRIWTQAKTGIATGKNKIVAFANNSWHVGKNIVITSPMQTPPPPQQIPTPAMTSPVNMPLASASQIPQNNNNNNNSRPYYYYLLLMRLLKCFGPSTRGIRTLLKRCVHWMFWISALMGTMSGVGTITTGNNSAAMANASNYSDKAFVFANGQWYWINDYLLTPSYNAGQYVYQNSYPYYPWNWFSHRPHSHYSRQQEASVMPRIVNVSYEGGNMPVNIPAEGFITFRLANDNLKDSTFTWENTGGGGGLVSTSSPYCGCSDCGSGGGCSSCGGGDGGRCTITQKQPLTVRFNNAMKGTYKYSVKQIASSKDYAVNRGPWATTSGPSITGKQSTGTLLIL